MILDEIVARKKADLEDLKKRYENWSPPAKVPLRRNFLQAITEKETISLIAEFKRRSPSKGEIKVGADPIEIARLYEKAGAAAMSVLTDHPYFGGSFDDLIAARKAVALPVLRKDFILDKCQLAESSGPEGPDCVLLIAAALTTQELRSLRELAVQCGQAALVEVHNEEELARALESGAQLIGINNRDLGTFQVSLETTLRLRPRVPDGIPVVAESGIHTAEDVQRLAEAGIDAMLVGEALMIAPNPIMKIIELLGQ